VEIKEINGTNKIFPLSYYNLRNNLVILVIHPVFYLKQKSITKQCKDRILFRNMEHR